jgi:hypothetical protein
MESQMIRPGHLTAHRKLVQRGKLARSGGTERQPWYPAADVAALVAKRDATKVA